MLPDLANFPATPAAIRRALAQHYKAGAALFLGIALLALVGAIVMPRSYLSEAKVFVRFGRENLAVDPAAATGQVLSIYETRENEINSLLEVMRSRVLLDAVTERIGAKTILSGHLPRHKHPRSELPANDVAAAMMAVEPTSVQQSLTSTTVAPHELTPPSKEHMQAVHWLERNVFIDAARKSSVISIGCKAGSPELAQRVAAELTDLYLREHTLVNSKADSFMFFQRETEKLQAAWDRASQELQAAKDKSGIVTIEGRRKYLESHLEDLQLRQTANRTTLAQSKARIEALSRELKELPDRKIASSAEVPNAAADQMRNTYYQLQLQAIDVASRMDDSHPLMKAARERVKEGADALAKVQTSREQTTTETHPARKALELILLEELANREAQQGIENSLAQQVVQANAKLKSWGNQEIEIARLQRSAELAEKNYRSAAEKLEQARISRELDQQHITNLRLVQPASFNDRPTGPGRKVVLLLGAFAATLGGLGLPLCLAWLASPVMPRANFLDNVVSPRAELERDELEDDVLAALDLPVIATVYRATKPERTEAVSADAAKI